MFESDIQEIMDYLPHRYPFLLLDRITEFAEGKSVTALKNVTINEPFFQGHFGHYPVMPGVLILEALAQASGMLAFKSTDMRPDDNNVYFFVGIDKARFRQPVRPGDQLIMNVEVDRVVKGMWRFSGRATVDGKLAASSELMCTLKEI